MRLHLSTLDNTRRHLILALASTRNIIHDSPACLEHHLHFRLPIDDTRCAAMRRDALPKTALEDQLRRRWRLQQCPRRFQYAPSNNVNKWQHQGHASTLYPRRTLHEAARVPISSRILTEATTPGHDTSRRQYDTPLGAMITTISGIEPSISIKERPTMMTMYGKYCGIY